MRAYLLLIFTIIAFCLSAQVHREAVYFNSRVSRLDSLKIDSVWKVFKTALLMKDTTAVKALSPGNFCLSLIKPEQSSAFPITARSKDAAIDNLFRIVQEPDFFSIIEKSYVSLSVIAEAEAKKPPNYESINPVIFSLLFTEFPAGSANNKGWNFAFIRSGDCINFFGLTQL